MAVNLVGQAVNLLAAFACRSFLARCLAREYLGVNGLFSDILSVFALSELGIGTAMLYAMYVPASINDEQKLTKLLNLYRCLYRIVAAAVLVIGLFLLPFLGVLIKGGEQVGHLRFYYLLFLADSVCSYLFIYQTALLTVHQKQYIYSLYKNALNFLKYVFQLLALYLTRNFTLYLVIQITSQILTGVLSAWHTRRLYPYTKNDRKSLPPKEERQAIYKNVGAMALHKLGDVAVNHTDSLIMSAFVGLEAFGLYSNYLLVTNNLSGFLFQIVRSLAGSVGNLCASESPDKIYDVYKTGWFGAYLCYSFCTVMMACLFKPFIRLVFGEGFLLPDFVVLAVLVNFYVQGLRQMTLCFRDAMGVFWYDRYKPLLEVVINLGVSLALVTRLGITGVLIGTTASNLLAPFWIEPLVLFRYGIKKEWKRRLMDYFIRYFICTAVMLAVGGVSLFSICRFPGTTVSGFLLRGILCAGMYCTILCFVFFRTREFHELFRTIRKLRKC